MIAIAIILYILGAICMVMLIESEGWHVPMWKYIVGVACWPTVITLGCVVGWSKALYERIKHAIVHKE